MYKEKILDRTGQIWEDASNRLYLIVRPSRRVDDIVSGIVHDTICLDTGRPFDIVDSPKDGFLALEDRTDWKRIA